MTIQKWLADVHYDNLGTCIWNREKDGGNQMIADIRGWGAIQNEFKTNEEAEKFQDEVGEFIVQAIREKIAKTSSQTEISEHRFTEKDIRFAYMQGYNRGVDGNPNHMESYIEHLKSTKTSQTEISDEEIEKEIKKRYETTQNDAGFRDGCAWYREQLKKKQ